MHNRGGILIGLLLVLLLSFTIVSAQDEAPVRIIFMHHSTGLGVIREGNVRQLFTNLGYEFWDHGYNEEGLTNNAGEQLGMNWDVPGDNTDPDGWYETFNQPYTDPPSNTFSHMLDYDVIIFKSCFPTSDIYDEDMLTAYKNYYLSIRDVIDQHPDKLFIPWTTPPLVPNETSAENAARARRWAAYLTSPEYLDGHPNIVVFDINSLLADEDGFLAAQYRQDEWDSHPNYVANQMLGPLLVELVDEAVQNFTPGEATVQPVDPGTVEQVDTSDVPVDQPEVVSEPAVAVNPGDVIEDFEAGPGLLNDRWWYYIDMPPEPGFDMGEGHESQYAVQFTFDVGTDNYAGLGMDFYPSQDWSTAEGIQFWWKADQPGMAIAIFVWVENPEDMYDPTPFLTHLEPGADWEPVTLTWDNFIKADWIGDAGVADFDPARIARISFDVGNWEQAQKGVLWLDDLALIE